VVCFVKDNLRRSYFIRVYDMDRMVLVFDQEIYNQFRYKAPRPYFHTFEGDDSQIGLNFADEAEAATFQQTIEAKLAERKQRRERRQAARRQQSVQSNGVTSHGITNGGMAVKAPAPLSMSGLGGGGNFNSGKKGDKKKLKKEDIGMPTNFQHISHVGWDPNHGFDLENVDPNLKKFFHKAGVDEKALQDKDTRDFIYDFIDKHGGVEAALREVNSSQEEISNLVPPPPPRNPGNTMSRPPPPSRAPPVPQSLSRASGPSHKAPPPPAPAASQAKLSSNVPLAAPPPPPPPPPPPSSVPPPPAPLMTQMTEKIAKPSAPSSLPNIDTGRNNLMEEIRRGGTLRHVSPEKKNKVGADSRGDLMDQIRQGVALKKVDSSTLEQEPRDVCENTPGIAGMLQRALQERGVAMGLSDSEGEDSGDDDEWDD